MNLARLAQIPVPRSRAIIVLTTFTLALVGWALFANYLGLYLITALTMAALYLIVLLEERELRERFGPAYADYSARVPRFIPRRR